MTRNPTLALDAVRREAPSAYGPPPPARSSASSVLGNTCVSVHQVGGVHAISFPGILRQATALPAKLGSGQVRMGAIIGETLPKNLPAGPTPAALPKLLEPQPGCPDLRGADEGQARRPARAEAQYVSLAACGGQGVTLRRLRPLRKTAPEPIGKEKQKAASPYEFISARQASAMGVNNPARDHQAEDACASVVARQNATLRGYFFDCDPSRMIRDSSPPTRPEPIRWPDAVRLGSFPSFVRPLMEPWLSTILSRSSNVQTGYWSSGVCMYVRGSIGSFADQNHE